MRYKTIIIITVALFVVVACLRYYFKTESIEFTLVGACKNTSKKRLEYGGTIFGDMDIRELNNTLYEWIRDSLTEKPKLDFNRYDYILGFGSPVKSVFYYKNISNPNDDCDYARFVPVNIRYQNLYTDSIYFYRIVKDKYRNICP